MARNATTVGATCACRRAPAKAASSSATIARTAPTSSAAAARSSRPASVARSAATTPGRACTARSTSRGSATSSTRNGRPPRSRTRRLDHVGTQHHFRSASTGHHHVDVDECPAEPAQLDRPSADDACEALRAVRRTAGDHDIRALTHQRRGGQRRHGAGSDDQSLRTRHAGRGHSRESDRYDRTACRVDAGFGVAPFANAQSGREERLENPAHGLRGLSPPVGVANLTEDLAFADDHRVESACHVEQMGYGGVLVVDVEM